ncbi:MAG: hypothetical protein IPK87_06905 [Planctomycetes bacterium]|nr:hypothetical protein [Planctomycetota bacterium]
MTHEELQILMQRAIDGVIADTDRDVLARALKADPVLQGEFDELQTVHAATEQLFRQISLSRDFSTRVMRRIQGVNVPADESIENVRLPEQRPLGVRSKRHSLVRVQRRRLRIYAGIAAVSAAAAFLLSVGVITGAFTRPVDTSLTESADKDSRGGPGKGGDHRTDPSSHVSEEREAPVPEKEPGASRDTTPGSIPGESADGNKTPREQPDKGGPDSPGPVEKPDSVVDGEPKQPGKESAPEAGQPDPTESPAPKGEVESGPEAKPQPGDRPGTEAAPRLPVGKLVMLSGRADTLGIDGKWSRMDDGAQVSSGMQMRTSANGVAMLTTDNGTLVLGKGTEVAFDDKGTAALVKGDVSLDRTAGTGEIELVCDGYTVNVRQGYTMVSRRKNGIGLKHVSGFAFVSHEVDGSMLLDRIGESEVEFGKPFPTRDETAEVRPARLLLPDWNGDARASLMLAAVKTALDAREMKRDERSYVDSNLSKSLARLLCHSVDEAYVLEFVEAAIANPKFHGKLLVQVANEVENAFCDRVNLDLELNFVARCAGRASHLGEDFKAWKLAFEQLMHPPVQRPAQPTPTAGDPDCPAEAGKVKRVEKPPAPKIIKKTPDQPEGENTESKPEPDAADKTPEKKEDAKGPAKE